MLWGLAPRAGRLLREKGWLDLEAVFEVLEVLRYAERGRAALGVTVGADRDPDPWEWYRYPALGRGLRQLATRMLRAGCAPEIVRAACQRFEDAWFGRL